MQNRLSSWPPLVNRIRTNTEAFNSISRQPGVVFKAHVVCSAGTTPVFWSLNSISSLTKERFDFTGGRQPVLEVSCQDRPLRISRGKRREVTQTHILIHPRTHKQIQTSHCLGARCRQSYTTEKHLQDFAPAERYTAANWQHTKWKNMVLFKSSSRHLESISVHRADCVTGTDVTQKLK